MNRQPIAVTSQPAKPGWRSSQGRTKPEGKLWSKQNSQATAGLSRGFKLFVSFTALLGLTVFLTLLLFRGDLRPTVLVFPITEYAYPWAPNGWATEDAKYLVSQAKESAKFYAVTAEERQDRSWEEWLDAHLKRPNFIAGGPGNSIIFPKYQSLIVYLSGHVDTNEAGEPCLLVPRGGTAKKNVALEGPWYGADPIPLKRVIEKLCKGMNNRKRNWWSHATHRKLIVLDIGKLPSRLQLGATPEKLHDLIRNVVESMDEPELAVLVASGPNQRSWTLPERGGSNFGLHFARALAGAAVVKGSDRITLEGVIQYLEKHVDDTAQSQRFESQTPVCYRGANGKAANDKASHFEIAFVGTTRFKHPPSGVDRSDFKPAERIEDAWNRFSKWQSSMIALDPWLASETLARLTNTESLLMAGPAYGPKLNEELEKVDSLLGRSAPTWPVEHVGGQSNVLKINLAYEAISNEDLEKILAWLEQKTQADGKVLTDPPKLNQQAAIASAWSWIVQRRDKGSDLSVEEWSRAVSLVEQASFATSLSLPSRDVVLFQAMNIGIRSAMDQNKDSVARMVKEIPRFLDAHQKLVDINNPKDPRLWQWLDSQFGLHHAFFDALDNWLLSTTEGLQRSDSILSELLGTADTESKLNVAEKQKTELEVAWQLHDELSMLLPTLDWIAEHESQLVGNARISSDEMSNLFKLRRFLVQPKVDNQGFASIQDLKLNWQSLKQKFFVSAQRLASEQSSIDLKSRRDITLWLQQPVDLRGTPSTRSILRNKL